MNHFSAFKFVENNNYNAARKSFDIHICMQRNKNNKNLAYKSSPTIYLTNMLNFNLFLFILQIFREYYLANFNK